MSMLRSIFESRETKDSKSHFKNLVSLAYADGELHESESELLIAIGAKMGLAQSHIQSVLSNPDRIKFRIPVEIEKRAEFLNELILMMLADGKVTGEELDFCQTVAVHFGFRANVVQELLGVGPVQIDDKPRLDVEAFLADGW